MNKPLVYIPSLYNYVAFFHQDYIMTRNSKYASSHKFKCNLVFMLPMAKPKILLRPFKI